MLKLCKVCGEYKEESEFPVHSHGRLRSTCKRFTSITEKKN